VQQVDLLLRVEISEESAIESAAGLVDSSEAQTVSGLEVSVRSAKLTVDVVDDASPGGSGILVGRDDLVRHGCERAGFVDAEESPRGAIAGASHVDTCCGSGCSSGLQESPAVQPRERVHGALLRIELYRSTWRCSVTGIT